MKTAIFFLILLILNVSFSEEIGNARAENPAGFFKKKIIGVKFINHRYTEPGVVSDTGDLYGAYGSLTYKISDSTDGILLADVAVGTLKYDGGICSTSGAQTCAPYEGLTNDFILKMTNRFNFNVSESLDLFAGAGIRYLNDKGQGSAFYTRIGTYLYLPVGGTVKYALSSGSNIYLDLEYEFFLSGVMKSALSEVDASYQDIVHHQSKGSGTTVALSYACKGDSNPLTVTAYYENWNIGRSDSQPEVINGVASGRYYVEPKNFTDSVGVGVGFAFN